MRSQTVEADNQPNKGLPAIVLRNSFFGIAGQLLIKILSVLFSILVVRRLGDVGYGKYSFILAYVAIFAIFSQMGLSPYTVREIAKDRSQARFLFWNTLALRLILSVITIALTTASAHLLGYSPAIVCGVFVASLGLLLQAVQRPFNGIMVGSERLDYQATVRVAKQLVFVLIGTVLLLRGGRYMGLLIASLGGVAAMTVLSARIVLRRYGVGPMAIQPRRWPRLLRASIPFGVVGLATMTSYKIDTVLLSFYHGDAMVGWYAAPYNLIMMLMIISHSINQSLYPSLTRRYTQDTGAVNRVFGRVMKYLLIISLPIAMGATILARPIVAALYGDAFRQSALALQVLIWVLPAMFLTDLFGHTAMAMDNERGVARLNAVSAVFNVTLNLLLIPAYGLVGAAVTTVLTELVEIVQYRHLLRREMRSVSLKDTLVRPLAAGIMMSAFVLVARSGNLLVTVPTAAAIYCGCIVLTRAVDPAETRFLGRLLLRRAPVEVR